MKNIIIILLHLSVGMMAQSQTTEPLYGGTTYAKSNYYYKDTFNDLNNFTGTWIYTNGSTSLTITLVKKIKLANGNFFEDVLVGGYKYVLNGITIVNTLPLLQNSMSAKEYTINGNNLIGPNNPRCIGCSTTSRIIFLGFWEPDRDVWNYEPEMQIERQDAGTTQKIKLVFRPTASATPASLTGPDPVYDSHSIPFGTYILTKQ